MAFILAMWFSCFFDGQPFKAFHFCLQSGCTTIAVGFAATVLNLMWLIRLFTSVFIPVMNSNAGTWGFSCFFFLSEKEESLGREKTNGCREK